MLQWKQRLYAFLLRRVLGPFLAQDALAQLHECIDVSIHEGMFALQNINLNLDKLTDKLNGFIVIKARVSRLEIVLNLLEHGTEEPEGSDTRATKSSSFAWRALQFTSTLPGSKVSLLANVSVSGLVLELAPCDFREMDDSAALSASTADLAEPVATEASKSISSVLASYIDAAMASLRLSLELENIRVRISDGPGERKTWIEVQLRSATYRDAEQGMNRQISCNKMILNKVVDFARISLLVGCDDAVDADDKSAVSTVALLDGTSSQIAIRVFEGHESSTKEALAPRIQQDIHVELNQRLSVSVDAVSLSQIHSIMLGLLGRNCRTDRRLATELATQKKANQQAVIASENDSEKVDQMDLRTIDGIMKEYYKARLLAEQNHFRGGILLPAEDDYSESGSEAAVTFDAFFDANDQSITNISTILKESLMATGADDGALLGFVHSKLRLSLSDGCLKAVFGTSGNVSSRRRADEYILLSFSELTFTSSLSHEVSEHTLHVSRLDVEDSKRISSDSALGNETAKRVDIGTVLKFAPTGDNDSFNHSGIVLAPPCIAMNVRASKDGTEIEIELDSLEVNYRDRTLANVLQAIQSLSSASVASAPSGSQLADEDRPSPRPLSVTVTCPAVTFAAPLLQEKAWGNLYDRRGYSVSDAWIAKSSLALCLQGLVFEASAKDSEPRCSVGFQIATFYAVSPSNTSMLDRSARRFDLCCFSGHSEVDPAIEVVVKMWESVAADGGGADRRENFGVRLFPKVPAISSFKARQEDDDEESSCITDGVTVHSENSTTAIDDDPLSKRRPLVVGDPQAEMLHASSKCHSALEVIIPELLVDVTWDELIILLDMLKVVANDGACSDADHRRGPQRESSDACMAISVICDEVVLELRETSKVELSQSSLIAHLTKIQTHLVLQDKNVRQMRFLSHDLSLIEAWRPIAQAKFPNVTDGNTRRRLRDVLEFETGSRVIVLVHRTKLFPALSSQSPAILIDLIDQSSGPYQSLERSQRNVYATLYDFSFRVNYGGSCLERLASLFDRLNGKTNAPNPTLTFQVLRLFFFIVDCNLDYASSSRFATPSRLILRIGDLRLSSNVVSPKPAAQAFAGSLCDVALYVSKTKYPFDWENSQIPLLLDLNLAQGRESGSEGSTFKFPDSIQKLMGLTAVALLDSLDAKVTISNVPSSDPGLLVKLTIGELGVYAAKDSFAKLLSSITELVADLTALDPVALEDLRSKSFEHFVEAEKTNNDIATEASNARFHALEDLKRQSALRPTAGTSTSSGEPIDFLLDGYDWTAVDQDESAKFGVPAGEEQVARWYENPGAINSPLEIVDKDEVTFLPTFTSSDSLSPINAKPSLGPNLISHHFPFHPFLDPLGDNDMDFAKLAGKATSPSVQTRVLVEKFSFKIRCFDGFDWPELLDDSWKNALGAGAFVLDQRSEHVDRSCERKEIDQAQPNEKLDGSQSNRKQELMGELLGTAEAARTFRDVPLPEERGALLREQAALQRLSRRPSKYLQVSASGISLKFDSLKESREHRLASCLSVKVHDMFVAETISSNRPVKFAGEWVSDTEHPRDSGEGLITLKMATWHPIVRVTPNNEIEPEESEAVFRILPLRCIIDQKAIRFAQAFFRSDGASDIERVDDASSGKRYCVPPPLFRSFRFKAFKLKVDYRPEKVNARAIYNGALVELINLSPLDGMVLTLQPVRGEGACGWGEVFGAAASHWLRDVCATQLHKFVASARPLEPITALGSTALDMVVLPWEAIQNGESVQRALRTSTGAFSAAVVTESLTLTSRLTQLVADRVARWSSTSVGTNVLPSRPLGAPRDLLDTAPHAVESLARGLQAANYRIIVVPYREYRRRGATGAVTSVLRGIPVAIAAPASGAAEALSFAALGARNQVRPDLRKEEEASLRGLHWEG